MSVLYFIILNCIVVHCRVKKGVDELSSLHPIDAVDPAASAPVLLVLVPFTEHGTAV